MILLDDIVDRRRQAVENKKGKAALNDLRHQICDAEPTREFYKRLARPCTDVPHLIAEIKQKSPSKGTLREPFSPIEIAHIYQQGGAAALSILTEPHFFGGQLSDLMNVRKHVSLPLLQKDFILDEYQIYEARAWGADAILLIAALLTSEQTHDYFEIAQELHLDVLLEVHTEKELEQVIDWAPVIGINNRDLKTFQTDLETTLRILKEIPQPMRQNKVLISESGISSKEALLRLYEARIQAVLIGEAFMTSYDMTKKMQEMGFH